jgi:hypothetical protein
MNTKNCMEWPSALYLTVHCAENVKGAYKCITLVPHEKTYDLGWKCRDKIHGKTVYYENPCFIVGNELTFRRFICSSDSITNLCCVSFGHSYQVQKLPTQQNTVGFSGSWSQGSCYGITPDGKLTAGNIVQTVWESTTARTMFWMISVIKFVYTSSFSTGNNSLPVTEKEIRVNLRPNKLILLRQHLVFPVKIIRN